jgi:hypothetical protein
MRFSPGSPGRAAVAPKGNNNYISIAYDVTAVAATAVTKALQNCDVRGARAM